MDGEFFENEAWYFRLILEGEDRIAENGRKKEAKRIEGSYSQLEEEDHCVDMADPNADFVAKTAEAITSKERRKQTVVFTALFFRFIKGASLFIYS